MKINFAQVSAQDVDTFGDEGLFGPDSDGNFYYNTLEYGTNPGGLDEVAIHDGPGRYMPIAIEHIPSLVAALQEAHAVAAELRSLERIKNVAESNTQAFVGEDDMTIVYSNQDFE